MGGLSTMFREGGFQGMLKGNGANCARIIPNSAVKFLTYEMLSERLADTLRRVSPPPPPLPFSRTRIHPLSPPARLFSRALPPHYSANPARRSARAPRLS